MWPKAREFLEAAELTHDLGLFNAATSSAVTSGINSKDAICLALTGRTKKGDNHLEAVAELKASGPVGRETAQTFSRLLKLKSKSQYQASSTSAADAAKSIDWAARMVDSAQVVAGNGSSRA
ncbi:HEPN domain-containing protein [Kribbella caucasensis]|uniref:HEPN domain-containing protein n=1 Tax=Kribbella caucasensis TaxID=2512215 RepID=UPI00192DAA18|nr:HEPN domain-containing protein [Kribbella sp. VKM Ac-2527]